MARNHLADIESGEITKTNVIGISKAIRAADRRANGWCVSVTAPQLNEDQLNEIFDALWRLEPKAVGELHRTGLKIVQSPRYRKRLEAVAAVIAAPDLSFHLVAFRDFRRPSPYGGGYIDSVQPVYRARSCAGTFLLANVPWQSGGNGPEIL